MDPSLQLRRLRKVRIAQRMEPGLVQRGQGSHRAGEVTSKKLIWKFGDKKINPYINKQIDELDGRKSDKKHSIPRNQLVN